MAGAVLPRTNGYMRSHSHLHYHIERHNASAAFREVCTDVYRTLSGDVLAASDEVGADGTPLLRLLAQNRVGYEWHLAGDVGDEALDVQAVVVSPQPDRVYPTLGPGAYRREWNLVVALDVEILRMWPGNQSGAGEMADSRCINVTLH